MPAPLRLLIAALIATVLAGSTAAAAPPKSTFVRHVETLCATELRGEAKIQAPHFDPTKATAKDMPAGAAYLAQLGPIVSRLARQAAAVDAPPAQAAAYRKLVAAWADLGKTLTHGATVARAGDVRGFRAGYAAVEKIGAHADELAKQVGATSCAG